MQAADREAELRSLHCQAATLVDDAETAQLRAEKAERRMRELHEETQRLRDSASQACATEQVVCSHHLPHTKCWTTTDSTWPT